MGPHEGYGGDSTKPSGEPYVERLKKIELRRPAPEFQLDGEPVKVVASCNGVQVGCHWVSWEAIDAILALRQK